VCAFETFPEFKFGASSDQTGALPGLVCSRIDTPLPGSSTSDWYGWAKVLRLIDLLP